MDSTNQNDNNHKNETDPFLKSLALLKEMVAASPPPRRRTTTTTTTPSPTVETAAALRVEVERERQQRESLEKAIEALTDSRHALQAQLDVAKEQVRQKEPSALETQMEEIKAYHAGEIKQEQDKRAKLMEEQKVKHESEIKQLQDKLHSAMEKQKTKHDSEMKQVQDKLKVALDEQKATKQARDVAEARATSLQARVQELHSQVQQKDEQLKDLEKKGQEDIAMQQKSVKVLLEELKKTRAMLKESKEQAAAAATAALANSSCTEEPPAKRAKTEGNDWLEHSMNIQGVIMKADEAKFLSEIAESELSVLKGIGPKSAHVLESMHLKTIKDLADYKFYKIARAIKVLSTTEGKRMLHSCMNLDHALIKEHETKSLNEILELPVSALEGLSPRADDAFKQLGVETVQQLADFKYAVYAEAITTLAPYEETKTKEELKLEHALKKLA